MYWGYSPSIDLLKEILGNECLKDEEEFNILIAGASDGRHILKTIAKYYTNIKNDNDKKKLNLYVYEGLLELIARQIILFLIAFEPSEELGLNEKAHIFMEVYGNTLIRPKTFSYINKKSHQLIHCVTDLNYLSHRLPIIDLSLLKYKERDSLETIFKFWREDDNLFDIEQIWNKRIRQALGIR